MPYKQTGSRNYWISYVDASGRSVRRSAGTEDFQEAKALEQQLRAKHYTARKKSGGVSAAFEQVLVEYLSREDRLDRATRSRARHLADFFRGRSFHDITRTDVIRYIEKRRETVAVATVNRELALLSAAIEEFNRRHGYTITNPASKMKAKEPEGIVRWISRQDAERLIACASPPVGDFIRLALYTGMRASEMYGLEWARVDFDRKLITLEAIHTKAERRRTIPIHPEARLALDSCKARHPGHLLVFGGVKCFTKGFDGARRRAGLQNFRIHDMRHTFASWLVMKGVNLYEVKDLLGHSTIELTQRYAHLAPENLRRAVDQL